MLCSGLRHDYRLVSSALYYLKENAITVAVIFAAQILALGGAECIYAPRIQVVPRLVRNRYQSPICCETIGFDFQQQAQERSMKLLHYLIQPGGPKVKTSFYVRACACLDGMAPVFDGFCSYHIAEEKHQIHHLCCYSRPVRGNDHQIPDDRQLHSDLRESNPHCQ